MKKIITISILLLILLSSCGANTCSKKNVQKYVDSVIPLFTKWDDQMIVANSTARFDLSVPISNLQTTKREFMVIEHPDCLNIAHDSVSNGMNETINGFISFMSNNEINLAGSQIESGMNIMKTGLDSIISIKKCAPKCKK